MPDLQSSLDTLVTLGAEPTRDILSFVDALSSLDSLSCLDAQPASLPGALGDIDSRQDEVLRLLDELNTRLERTLAQFASFAPASKPRHPGQEAA